MYRVFNKIYSVSYSLFCNEQELRRKMRIHNLVNIRSLAIQLERRFRDENY